MDTDFRAPDDARSSSRGSIDPARSPIFILGTGRSGTTLLRLMLSAHPRIYIAHEASFYVWESLFPRRRSGMEFLRYFFQTFSFRWLRLSPAEILRELPPVLPRSRVEEAFTVIMRSKAGQYGRVRFGDKTPSHSAALRQIFRDFPDARVIHMVRDPRGVVLSLSRMPWASRSIAANAALCEIERRQVAPFVDRVCEVRLEDLLADTRSTMERVLQFVGEPWDDAVLDHEKHVPDVHDLPPFEWLKSAAQKRGTPNARWQDLPPHHLRLIERLCRNSMAQFGYAPATLEREPSGWAVRLALLSDLPEAVRFGFSYLRLGVRFRDPQNFEGESTRRLFRRLNPGAWHLYEGDVLPDPPPLPPGWEVRLLRAEHGA